MTVVGRSKLDHPALGTTGGASLHTTIEGLWESVSDDLGSRYSEHASIADSGTVTIDHNFGKAIELLQVHILTGTHPNLTKVKDPAAAGWTIAATTGFEKEKIDITAPSSGGPHTFSVSIFESSKAVDNLSVTGTAGEGFIDLTAQSSDPSNPASGDVRVFVGSDGKTYKLDDAGNKSQLGGGSGSGINYLADLFEADLAPTTTSVAAIDTTNTDYSNFLVSSAGGTLSQDTASSVRGANSYKFVPSASGEFFGLPAFQLASVDLGKALSIKFDLKNDGAAADWDVVVCRYNSSGVHQETVVVAGTASAGTPASAQLPTGLTSFRGFFITGSDATDYYRLFVRHLTSATDAVYLDTLVVGPEAVMEGAIVTEWEAWPNQSIIASTTNPTLTSDKSFYQRTGKNLFYKIDVSFLAANKGSGNYYVALPTGLNIDTSVLNPVGGVMVVGFGTLVIGSTQYLADVYYTVSGGFFEIRIMNEATARNQFDSADVTSTAYLRIDGMIPISEWQANTQMAARAVEEYASNSGLEGTTIGSTYSNSTYFEYGPNGSLMPNITTVDTTGGSTSYGFKFKTPILPTDAIILEYKDATTWRQVGQGPLGTLFSVRQLTTRYGAVVNITNADAGEGIVEFGRGGTNPTTGAYGAVGNSWSGFYTAGYRWRVRKVSGGAQVGFPVSARNVIGDTSGTAVPAGYVGETLTVTGSLAATTTAYATGATLTLTDGVWLFSASGFVSGAAGFTGLQSRLNIKGAASYAAPYTDLKQSCPSGGYAITSFPTQTVVVASGDADKTIKFDAATLGANSTVNIYISATRIA